MTRDLALFLPESGRFVRLARPLAQIGPVLLALSCLACGSTGSDSGDAGNGSGGAGSGGTPTGGSSSGGTASGGSASGGASTGGGGTLETVPACPGEVAASEAVGCRSHTDCLGGMCLAERIATDGICGACFPSPAECTLDVDCGDGKVCVTGPERDCQCMGPGLVCAAPCSSDSCPDEHVCRADGHCTPASCADEGYACPSATVCAPERAGDVHGCAPSLCDSDGHACPSGTLCDPERAGDGHGCTPSLCDSDGYVCPDDTACAPERAGDAHGCAARLCDSEGFVCPDGKTCNPVSGADAHGCQYVHCADGYECLPNTDCLPTHPEPPGCVTRACTADTDCDCGACVLGYCANRLYVCVVLPA